MKKEKILDKVQKILNLAAKAGTQHEAETAMLMAQKLLVKNKLSMSDVKDGEKKYVTYFVVGNTKEVKPYKERIVGSIKDFFFCEVLKSKGNYKTNFKEFLIVVGKKDDADVFVKILNFIFPVYKRLLNESYKKYKEVQEKRIPVAHLFPEYKDWDVILTKEQFGVSYSQGFSAGLYIKFKEQREQTEQEYREQQGGESTPFAIILKREREEIMEWLEKNHNIDDPKKPEESKHRSRDAEDAGYWAAKDLNINAVDPASDRIKKSLKGGK
jgi:hypothetical protein